MRTMEMIIMVILLFCLSTLLADIPDVISHQGRLVNEAGEVLDGEFRMVFSIYNAPTGGDLLWSETYMNVTVRNGLYHIFLGANTPFPDSLDFTDEYWLGIVVDGEALGPRVQLATSPYAFFANTAGEAHNILGLINFNYGYHLNPDSVVIGDDTIGTPQPGAAFVDTSGGDTLKIYLNNTWYSIPQPQQGK